MRRKLRLFCEKFFFGHWLIEDIIFFVTKIVATDAVGGILTIIAEVAIDSVDAILAEK